MIRKIITALDELKNLDFEHRRSLYPNAPLHSMPWRKFSDTTSNGMTGCILRWLQLNGHACWRQSSEGRYRQGNQYTDVLGRVHVAKGKFIPGTNKGHGDVASIIDGQFVSWEVKMKDKQSEKQKQFQKEVEQSAGKYFIVRSFAEFIDKYNLLVKTTISKDIKETGFFKKQ